MRITVIALCALVAGSLSGLGAPTAEAIGEAPELVITSPANGSVTNDITPVFRGTSTAPGDGFPEPETVTVTRGSSALGPFTAVYWLRAWASIQHIAPAGYCPRSSLRNRPFEIAKEQ